MVRERTATCEASGTDPCRPGTEALPTRSAPEAGKSQPPLLRSRRDQAIMSPLAKKKFLAQGSDSSFHVVGTPSSGVKPVKGSEVGHSLPASSCPPEASAHRPSVIHHVQQPRDAHPDYRSDWPFAHSLDKYPHYPFKPLRVAAVDGHGAREERDVKGRPAVHSQPPLCFGTFCSPYVQGIVKPLLHYPTKGGPLSCCANQRGLREFGGTGALGLPQRGRDQLSLASDGHKVARCYGRPLAPSDQPTDLSLPRGSGQRPAQAQPAWAAESKGGLSPLRRGSFSGRPASEGHPKACWVPPISVALPRRVPAKRAKSDGPPADAKGGPSPASCWLAQAPPRSQKELDATYGKKLRVVSPLLAAKDPGDGKATGADQKPAVPSWLPTALPPQAPACYEGARGRFPAAYAHHSDHLKGPGLFSPFVPSLTVNSFMIPAIPGQVLSPPGHPLDLYKHLAAGTPYESLLHHRLYPLTAWHPSPHLPSFQAGHKL